MKQTFDPQVIDRVIEELGAKPSATIAILQAVQEEGMSREM